METKYFGYRFLSVKITASCLWIWFVGIHLRFQQTKHLQCNICFSSSKLRKETCFGPIRNLLSLWINKICKKICENIWWICYMKIFAFQFQIVQFNSQFKYKVYLRYFKSDGLFSFYLLIDFVLVLPTIFFTAFQQCEKKAISDFKQLYWKSVYRKTAGLVVMKRISI